MDCHKLAQLARVPLVGIDSACFLHCQRKKQCHNNNGSVRVKYSNAKQGCQNTVRGPIQPTKAFNVVSGTTLNKTKPSDSSSLALHVFSLVLDSLKFKKRLEPQGKS